jgi:hypothetical protein
MAETNRPEMPRTQTSAPVEPPGTTRDVSRREEDDAAARNAREQGEGVRGDRMPRGADEPGAGL